ncbi:MAG: M15 family metallopeptidase [Patescibacteria group bacterium]
MKKVLVTGTFDLLHPGHYRLLQSAKRLGDFLTVVIARDETVKRVKGYNPFFTQADRVQNMRALGIAHRVIPGGSGDKLSVIASERPDIICLGYDQHAFTDDLEKKLTARGFTPRIVRIRRFSAGMFRTGGLHAAGLVALHRTDPTLVIEPRYATARNFTGQRLYHNRIILGRTHVARMVKRAQTVLRRQGYGLKIWDCYRPLSVQKILWCHLPDERYVGNPKKGPVHTRGTGVDCTLVDRRGRPLPMPTKYDEFSDRAHRQHPPHPTTGWRHSRILEQAMTRAGFEALPTEWWHFSDPRWKQYPVIDIAI